MMTIDPRDHGLFEGVRVALIDRETKASVAKAEIAPGEVFTIDPQALALAPAGSYAFKLQVRSAGRWQDATPYQSLHRDYSYVCERGFAAQLGSAVTVVDPTADGVPGDCRVFVFNTYSRKHILQQDVPAGRVLALPNVFFDGLASYRYTLKVLVDGRWQAAADNQSLTPAHLRGHGRPAFQVHRGSLLYTQREGVTVGPYISYPGSVAQSIDGFVRVHEEGQPVPEALRMTMGKQKHLFLPPLEPQEFLDGTFIWGGIPNPSWGHFLTEGVARLWYAKEHPEFPVVWHSRNAALTGMQAAVLDVLGIRNQHLFVHRPTRYARMVFPVPGSCLGDYVLEEHGAFLGAVDATPIVPGKKTYLSRGKLGSARGSSEDEAGLEALLQAHGFAIYHPELHSIRDQLAEISSSQVVLGIEGSALHSPVLLKAPLATRFVAIGRHRMGEGAYEHIRQAKGLDYRTLNLRKTTARLGAAAPLDIDLDRLQELLAATAGFTRNLQALGPYTCRADPAQTSYVDTLPHFRTALTDLELELARTILLLHKRDIPGALDVLLPMLQAIKVVRS